MPFKPCASSLCVVLLATSSLACSEKKTSKPRDDDDDKPKVQKIELVSDFKGTRCEYGKKQGPSCWVTVDVGPEKDGMKTYKLRMEGRNATFEAGSIKYKDKKVTEPVPFEVSEFLAYTVGNDIRLKIPFTVRFKDGHEGQGKVDMSFTDPKRAATLLRKVTTGPVKFSDDETAEKKKGALMVYGGSVVRLGEVASSDSSYDIVAVIENTREVKGSCGFYGNKVTGREIVSYRWDQEVVVYERRTGKELGKKTFPAPPVSCPKSLTADSYIVSEKATTETMTPFVMGFVK